MATKPSIPKGTRDFSADIIVKRDFIFGTIKEVFKLYGYQPIETPAMENLSTLMGKYGEEGERLIFRILNSGDFVETFREKDKADLTEAWNLFISRINKVGLSKVNFIELVKSYQDKNDRISKLMFNYFFTNMKVIQSFILKNKNHNNSSFIKYLNQYRFPHLLKLLERSILNKTELLKGFSEKGLRYDLTVPFARYVVQHHGEITLPFKRYQIQPVWRGDNPQKGRYREFYQCDADVIGSTSILNEYELIRIVDDVFTKLGIEITIKINNRKVLTALSEYIGEPDKIIEMTVAIDKISKIGFDDVIKELKNKGISDAAIEKLTPILLMKGNTRSKLEGLSVFLSNSLVGEKGLQELETLISLLENANILSEIELDLTLARGLNYYTGAIIEVKSKTIDIGSLCGGGRYDNLTEFFGLKNMSGVGISFGADRIFDVLTKMNSFQLTKKQVADFLVFNLGKEFIPTYLKINNLLHKRGLSSEVFPDHSEYKKQLAYAKSKNITYAIIIRNAELEKNELNLLNLITDENKKILMRDIDSFNFSG